MFYPVIGAISNGIRGGQLWRWLGFIRNHLPASVQKKHGKRLDKFIGWVRDYTPHDAVNALIFAACVYGITHDKVIAAVAFALMWLGASPGWGEYIGAIINRKKGKAPEVPIIDMAIEPLTGTLWGVAGLTLRGLFWGLMLAVPFIFNQQFIAAILFAVAGSCMGLIYWGVIRIAQKFPALGSGWSASEIVFGAVLWLPLAVAANH